MRGLNHHKTMRDEWVLNRLKAEKNSCEFCCSAKLLPDVIVLQSLYFSQNLCDLLSSCILCRPLPSVFRLVHMSRFLDICLSVRSSMFPPPQAPSRRLNEQ